RQYGLRPRAPVLSPGSQPSISLSNQVPRRSTVLPGDPPAAGRRSRAGTSRTGAVARMLFFQKFSRTAGRSAASRDRKSTRLNSSHDQISYAVFCLKKKKKKTRRKK